MNQVGEFMPNRRIIKSPANPMDKSTIVSILPKDIDETKHTIQPGRFQIKAGNYVRPSILVVGPSSWWKDLDKDQPLLEIPQSSIQIADSIVRDYCIGMLSCNMESAMPGLFFLPGEFTLDEVKTKYKPKLDIAKSKQDNWFRELVKLADSLWARSNGNPLTISDDMRLAAQELLLTKDWMKDQSTMELVRCFACGALRNPLYPVCATCKAVDQKHPNAGELKFAV